MSENLLQTPSAEPGKATARPADVPKKFWDAETGTLRVDALLKSYRELERRLSQRAAPPAADATPEDLQRFRQAMGIPETPDGYCINAPHDLCCSDPEVNRRLHAAHFTNDQAQLVYDLAAERLLPLIAEAAAQFEADRQREKLHAHFGGEERFRQVAAQLAAWGRAKLPAPVFEALSSTAEGVLALEQMMRKEEPGLSREAAPPAAASEAELRAMMRDPRYWRTREPEFVRRVTEGFRRLVGS
ncbi:MAG: hypothetical protein QJR07_07395 [Acetobacteraceae bacterium]|nr:hypothetical protein [Acetobacteraceae bacterium]